LSGFDYNSFAQLKYVELTRPDIVNILIPTESRLSEKVQLKMQILPVATEHGGMNLVDKHIGGHDIVRIVVRFRSRTHRFRVMGIAHFKCIRPLKYKCAPTLRLLDPPTFDMSDGWVSRTVIGLYCTSEQIVCPTHGGIVIHKKTAKKRATPTKQTSLSTLPC